jgi:hypothetical protein
MKLKLGLLVAFGMMVGCTTVPPKNDAALAKVKSVAIVGISVYQPDTDTLGKLTGIKTEFGIQNSEHVDALHNDLNAALARNNGWKTVSMKDMKANSTYRENYDKTMSGWQSHMGRAAQQNEVQYGSANFMDSDALRKLGVEGRRKLAEALKVDAIGVVDVIVTMGGTRIMGIGDRKPKADANFVFYDRENENHIWQGGVQGDMSTKSLGATDMVDFVYLNELSEASAKTAFDRIRR